MTRVFEFTNPFEPRKDFRSWEFPDGGSVWDYIRGAFGANFKEFEFPTICLVNGVPWKREEWDNDVPEGAAVSFVRLVQGIEAIIIAIVVVVVAVVVAVALSPAAVTPSAINGDIPEADPVYNLSGQKNQVKLNEPIECAYGKNRLWPTYAALPYNVYQDNEQFQFSLYCLGHGRFAVEEMRFEATPFQEFDDVEFEIVEPGGKLNLFADNVFTSSTVAGIELFGPNEKEFTGWIGNYPANPPYTKTTRIEIDIALTSGLYYANDGGGLSELTVQATFQMRKIDDLGRAIGDWQPLAFTKKTVQKTVPWNQPLPEGATPVNNGYGQFKGMYFGPRSYTIEESIPYFERTLATVTPQRYTLGADVPEGRYEVRAQRTNNKNTSHRAGNTVRWDALRAFFPSVREYGEVTLVAVKARASNNLNNNAAQRFNVIATRKLPTFVDNQWTAPVSTRSPLWAFCDVFRSRYGGRLPDNFLDLDYIQELAAEMEARSIYFDWIFDQRTTVWEAARSIARVARCVPMLDGSRITLVHDKPQVGVSFLFNQYNILAGSLTWSVKLVNVEEEDGYEIEYVDQQTWKSETVLCLVGDDAGINPKLVKLPGCADRTRAYREGLFMRASDVYIRESIEFKTGMEGLLARYGDVIMVQHDVPSWGQGGLVKAIVGNKLILSDPVTFEPGAEHRILLRKKDGSAFGPVACQAGSTDVEVIVNSALPDFYFDDVHERPGYLFGRANYEAKKCRIVDMRPESDDVVRIKAVTYDERVYAFDEEEPPAVGELPSSVLPEDRPVVKNFQVRQIFGQVQLSWTPALGAVQYVIQQSGDGVDWTTLATTSQASHTLTVPNGTTYFRVAAQNVDLGPWQTWRGLIGRTTPPANVTGLAVSAIASNLRLYWTLTNTADRYKVTVFEPVTQRQLRRYYTENPPVDYTAAQAASDTLTGQTVIFSIRGENAIGFSPVAATIEATFAALDDPTDSPRADSTQFQASSTKVLASDI